jgi:hypothetical protein
MMKDAIFLSIGNAGKGSESLSVRERNVRKDSGYFWD